jgi:hypothetical protein
LNTQATAYMLVENYLTTTISGSVEEGEKERTRIFNQVGQSAHAWRDIAWFLASEVSRLLETHELDTAFETIDRMIHEGA